LRSGGRDRARREERCQEGRIEAGSPVCSISSKGFGRRGLDHRADYTETQIKKKGGDPRNFPTAR
ncbi:MAG TPA: hypothetical protein VE131_05020, partial [Terriglobales bacterium]|nr:hypothetical protein [Terriglobales bacterium]